MGRIIIVHGDGVIEPEPEPLEPPEPACPFTDREREFLLGRRLDVLMQGVKEASSRDKLTAWIAWAIESGEYDLADAMISVATARDKGLQEIFATYLKELFIECGEQGLWMHLCEECGGSDREIRQAGRCWVEPGLCSQCADQLLHALAGDAGPGAGEEVPHAE